MNRVLSSLFGVFLLNTSAHAATVTLEFDFSIDDSINVTFDSSVHKPIAGPPGDDRVYFGNPIYPGSSLTTVELVRQSPYTQTLPLGDKTLGFSGTEIENISGSVRLESDGDFSIGDRQTETSGDYLWEYSFNIFTIDGIQAPDILNFNDTDLIAHLYQMYQAGTVFSFVERSGTRLSSDPLNWLEEERYILSGTIASITTIPIPASIWLFSSGLFGLMGMARRKIKSRSSQGLLH